MTFQTFVFILSLSAVNLVAPGITSDDSCLGLIFISQNARSSCDQYKTFNQVSKSLVSSYFNDPNVFAQYSYNWYPSGFWPKMKWAKKAEIVKLMDAIDVLGCYNDLELYFANALNVTYKFISSSPYSNLAIIWAGSLDLISDKSSILIEAAGKLASLNVPTFVWDYSSNRSSNNLFNVITHNMTSSVFKKQDAHADEVMDYIKGNALSSLLQKSCNPVATTPAVPTKTSTVFVDPTTSSSSVFSFSNVFLILYLPFIYLLL